MVVYTCPDEIGEMRFGLVEKLLHRQIILANADADPHKAATHA